MSNYEQLPVESGMGPSSLVNMPGRLVESRGGGELMTAKKQPEIITHGIRPIDLVYSMRRRWPLSIGLGLLVMAVTLIIAWFVIPVKYNAHVWLRVAKSRPKIIFDTATESHYLNDRNAQATLIRSSIVLDTALQQPGIAQLNCLKNATDKKNWLIQNLQVGYLGSSEILQIAISGEDPDELVKILMAVRLAYMDRVVAVDRELDMRRRMTLEQAYKNTEKMITRKRIQYRTLADQLGTPDSQTARYANIYALETVATLRNQVNALRAQISGLERKIALTKGRMSMLPAEEQKVDAIQRRQDAMRKLAAATLWQDPDMARMRQRLLELDSVLKDQAGRVKNPEKNPSITRLRSMIEELQVMLERRAKELIPLIEEQVKLRIHELERNIPMTVAEKMQLEIDTANMDKTVLQSQLESCMKAFQQAVTSAEKFSAGSTELDTLRAELDRMQRMYHQMGTQLDEWTIESGASQRVQTINEPEKPKVSDLPKKIQIMSILGLLSFAGTVVAVGGFDFLGRRVNNSDELSFGLGVHVMGDLPLITRGIHRHRVNQSVQGLLMESIDNIRTALLHRAELDNMNAVLITSSLEKEGKTTVSSQLAASLARTGRRVILLDADLRRPSSHRMFDRPLNPGLAEYLRGMASLDEIITTTRVENLWIIPAGTPHPDAIIALAQGGMEDPIKMLREQFDFVIVDSGPVLTDADVLVIGRLCDGIIMSVLRDVSRLPWVYEACERIRMVDIPLIGVVLNGVSFGKYRPYYSSYTIEVASQKKLK